MDEVAVGPSGSRHRREPVVANRELFRQRIYDRQLAGVVALHNLSWVCCAAIRRVACHEPTAINRWIRTSARIGSLLRKLLDDAEKLVTRIYGHGPVGRMKNLVRVVVVGIRFVTGETLNRR